MQSGILVGSVKPQETLQANISAEGTLQGAVSTQVSLMATVSVQHTLNASVVAEKSLKGTMSKPSSSTAYEVDAELSLISEKPVQNKVITAELLNKADLVDGKVPEGQLPDMECDALTNLEIEEILKNFS